MSTFGVGTSLGTTTGPQVPLAPSKEAQRPVGGSPSTASGDRDTAALPATGADIYKKFVRVPKRKRSPGAQLPGRDRTQQLPQPVPTQNRFGPLADDKREGHTAGSSSRTDAPEKPTPMYIRGNTHIGNIPKTMALLSIAKYDIKILKRGLEAKLQLFSVDDYRKAQDSFMSNEIPYYTYQLKSERSLRVAIKGLHPMMDCGAIKDELVALGFKPRNVAATKNYQRENTGVFIIDLDPEYEKTGNVSHHPIYDLKRFMHLVVSVEEPRKNKEPVRCYNCNEFGHTRLRCSLLTICTFCAENHKTEQCTKDRNNASMRKCNNCGGNHAANWKGCGVYKEFMGKMNPKQNREFRIRKNNQRQEVRAAQENFTVHVNRSVPPVPPSVPPGFPPHTQRPSYARVAAGSRHTENYTRNSLPQARSNEEVMQLIFMMQSNISAMLNSISDMQKRQNSMEDSIRSLSDALNKFLTRNNV